MPVAALDSVIPIAYGQVRLGALIANAMYYQGAWVFWVLWCAGPIYQFVSLSMNDQALPASSTVTHYPGLPVSPSISCTITGATTITASSGTPFAQVPVNARVQFTGFANAVNNGTVFVSARTNTTLTISGTTLVNEGPKTVTFTQGVDPTLKAAFAQIGIAGYAETVPGIAYSVIRVPGNAISGPPVFNAIVKALYLYDPRLDSTNGGSGSHRLADPTTWAWSRCPALQTAHFAYTYDGKTPSWANVAVVANANDALVGVAPKQEASRISDMVLDQERATGQWLEAMRTAAGCWLIPRGDVLYLAPDVAGASLASYSHAAGQILRITNEALQATTPLPTVLEVMYTDTTALPWRDVPIAAKRSGVDSGATAWVKSTVPMPWITRASQAYREAVERLNKLWLRSLSMNVEIMDEGLAHEPGDLISLTYPDGGYSSLQVRIGNLRPTDDGWQLAVFKEDPGCYSSAVQDGPTVGNTPIPLPSNPPAMGAITLVEDVPQVQTGRFVSRLVASWAAVDWPFIAGYEVTVSQGGAAVLGPVVVSTNGYTTPALPENLAYVVSVSVVSYTGTRGAASTAGITNSGKLAKPSNVPTFTGFEVGGEVRLEWVSASDRDLTAHEVRFGSYYGAATDASTLEAQWDALAGAVLDRVAAPSVRLASKSVAPGNWRFLIKGLDSVRSQLYPNGQESVSPTHLDLVVTSDVNAFVASTYSFNSPTLFNMVALPDPATGGTYYITDFGQTWNALFASAMNTYTNPLATYHTAGTSMLVSEVYDFGLSLTGDWTVKSTITDIGGVGVQVVMDLNDTGGTSSFAVTGATNATPIRITATGHTYIDGDEVHISGVTGNTAANGRFKVSGAATNAFDLLKLNGANTTGNGTYVSGGTATKWGWTPSAGATAKASARFARVRIITTGTMRVDAIGTIQVNVVARHEQSQEPITTFATAGVPYVVTLANHYRKAKVITAGLLGTAALTWTYDSVEVSGGGGIGAGHVCRFGGVGTTTADRLEIASQAVHQFNNAGGDLAFSIQVLVCARRVNVAQFIAGKGSGNPSGEYQLRLSANGRWRFILVDETAVATYGIEGDQLVAIDNWYFVTAAYTGAGGALANLALYTGEQPLAKTLVTTGTYARMRNTTHPFLVGNHYNAGAYNTPFQGAVDELRLWNVALTPADLAPTGKASVYAAISPSASGLVGYWKFDDLVQGAIPTQCTDSTANAKHLAMVNAPRLRPYDGFDLYAFSGASQAAAQMTWGFDGV